MKPWVLRVIGVFNILLGIFIIVANILLLKDDFDDTETMLSKVRIGFGTIITCTGVGILLHHRWARVVGIIVAILYAFICGWFVVGNIAEFRGGYEAAKLMLVLVMGYYELFTVGVLILGSTVRGERNACQRIKDSATTRTTNESL